MNYLEFAITSFLLAIMPGQDIIFVAVQSLSKGYKQGIKVAAGLTSGLVIHSLAIAIGIGAIIVSNEILFNTIKQLGASYLLYLAIMAALQVRKIGTNKEKVNNILEEKEQIETETAQQIKETNNSSGAKERLAAKIKNSKELLSPYKKGLIMNLLNPKVIIFFLALFPQFIDRNVNVYFSTISLGLIMALTTFVVFCSVSIVCSYAKKAINPSTKFKKIMKILEAIIYAALSALVIFNL